MHASPPFWRRELFQGQYQDLALVTYAVEPALLTPLVPKDTVLDLVDGRALVSLVAMRLVQPRVLGVGVPFAGELAQVNLRFYVREGVHQGVVFVREDVPSRVFAWGGRALFNEPYARSQVTCIKEEIGQTARLDYLLHAAGRIHHLSLEVRGGAQMPDAGPAKFIEQRPFAYGRARSGETLCYALSHPLWRTRPVERFRLDWDFAALYGERFAVLNAEEPHAVVFAEGSPVTTSLPWVHARGTRGAAESEV
jgi:hypothetical protein